MVDTGGAQRHPGNTERLMEFWVSGRGGKEINWDTPGDFARCQTLINGAIVKGGGKPLPDHEIKGLCARLHRRATGATPGHGQREQAMGDHHGD